MVSLNNLGLYGNLDFGLNVFDPIGAIDIYIYYNYELIQFNSFMGSVTITLQEFNHHD